MNNNTNAGHHPVCITTYHTEYRTSRQLLFVLLAVFFSLSIQAQFSRNRKDVDHALEKTVLNTVRQSGKQIQFVMNRGQENLPASVIAYCVSGNQYLFIEQDRLRVMVVKNTSDPVKDLSAVSMPEKKGHEKSSKKYRYNGFSIRFQGAKGTGTIETADQFGTVRNFIRNGSQSVEGIRSFSEVRLKDVYPGIDLRLYSTASGDLEFDWFVWPGADLSIIQMQFEGQQSLHLKQGGTLEVGLAMGKYNMHMPESYYVSKGIKEKADVRFKLGKESKVSFKQYSSKRTGLPLVIDPLLMWGTFFDGGNSAFDEYLYAIEFSYSYDLLYCAGASSLAVSTVYVSALVNGYDSSFSASPDALIYALTANGQTIKYITYLGGSAADVAYGVAVDENYVYVCGYTASADFPVNTDPRNLSFDSAYSGANDGFIAILSPSLDYLNYSSYLGGPGNDRALTVRCKKPDKYYVSLSVTDTLFATEADYLVNAADSSYEGASEAWIGEFSLFNSLEFGTYIGGTDEDRVNDFQLLSNGDIVFTGSTKDITEINAYVPDNGSGKEVLFGRLTKPALAPAYFTTIERIGGSNSEDGWGITCLGDTISVLVGQTNSNDFPLGVGTVFQNTRFGNYDGFIARISNDGTSEYKASFVGGSNVDILVSVRLISMYNSAYLMSFGSTQSTNLSTKNFNSETFYSPLNAGGLDMMFLITKLDLSTKVYLSYVGGSGNDYLGATGAPFGSNHLFYNGRDSVLYVGTTTHSNQSTHQPLYVGRGWADAANQGVPVFDSVKHNLNNDTHVIIAISTTSLLLLPRQFTELRAEMSADCRVMVKWKNENEESLLRYEIEKSNDGVHFRYVSTAASGSGQYSFTDPSYTAGEPVLFYRIKAIAVNGEFYYSPVQRIQTCQSGYTNILVYPAFIRDYLVVSNLPLQPGNLTASLYDMQGMKTETWAIAEGTRNQTCRFTQHHEKGMYLLVITDEASGKTLNSTKLLVQ